MSQNDVARPITFNRKPQIRPQGCKQCGKWESLGGRQRNEASHHSMLKPIPTRVVQFRCRGTEVAEYGNIVESANKVTEGKGPAAALDPIAGKGH